MARTPKPWYWEERSGWFVTLKGKRRRLAEGPRARTKGAAEREFHRLMVAEGRGVETDRSRMLARDLFDIYLCFAEGEQKRGERTEKSMRQCTRFLVSAEEALGSLKATEVRTKDLLAWADKETWGPSTRRFGLAIVKAVYAWATRTGHLQDNPIVGLELPKMRVREEIPTQAQFEAMYEAAWGDCFRDLLFALRETGCRPSEIITLTADRVDLDAGRWMVVNKTRRKTGEAFRPVYLTPAMIAMTREKIEANPAGHVFRNSRGEPWNERSVMSRFNRLRVKLGMGRECVAYAIRHMYITDALERGVNPATLAELVGHKSLGMIMRVYNKLRLRTDHLREAARLVRPHDGPSATSLHR